MSAFGYFENVVMNMNAYYTDFFFNCSDFKSTVFALTIYWWGGKYIAITMTEVKY